MLSLGLIPVRLFMTPLTVAHQTPLFMRFPRKEYWSGLPFPSPEDLVYPGIKPRSTMLQTDSLPSEPPGKLLLLLLLSRFSRVQLCATPEMTAHQAPASLGFSRQEYWSGVPLPSPISLLPMLIFLKKNQYAWIIFSFTDHFALYKF